MRPPLDDPRWFALKEALESLALQIGAAAAADKLRQAKHGERPAALDAHPPRDRQTRIVGTSTFWGIHGIDVDLTFGAVRGWDPGYNILDRDVLIEGFAFYVWAPHLERLFGIRIEPDNFEAVAPTVTAPVQVEPKPRPTRKRKRR